MRTRFILIEPSHAGNVGAVARAMKVMGFSDLFLVSPRYPNILNCQEAVQRASGALDVLHNARIVSTLDKALWGITHLCATVMTARDFGPSTYTPRDYLASLAISMTNIEKHTTGDVKSGVGVAFLFGSERYGMLNRDVWRCHVALRIETNLEFGSLNLASAVQVIAYEWRLSINFASQLKSHVVDDKLSKIMRLADAPRIDGVLEHWKEALTAIGYFNPSAPKKLLPRLRNLFNRASLSEEEVNILRGIARAILKKVKK